MKSHSAFFRFVANAMLFAGLIVLASGFAFSQTEKPDAARDRRADHGAWQIARRKSRGRFAGSIRLRLPSAQLQEADAPPLSGGLPAARLHGQRRQLVRREARFHQRARRDRRRAGGRLARDDLRDAERPHHLLRQHVLEFRHDRRLGRFHRARPCLLHRRALPHDPQSHEPRARRAFDGRIRHDSPRDDAPGGLFEHLLAQRVLPCRESLGQRESRDGQGRIGSQRGRSRQGRFRNASDDRRIGCMVSQSEKSAALF